MLSKLKVEPKLCIEVREGELLAFGQRLNSFTMDLLPIPVLPVEGQLNSGMLANMDIILKVAVLENASPEVLAEYESLRVEWERFATNLIDSLTHEESSAHFEFESKIIINDKKPFDRGPAFEAAIYLDFFLEDEDYVPMDIDIEVSNVDGTKLNIPGENKKSIKSTIEGLIFNNDTGNDVINVALTQTEVVKYYLSEEPDDEFKGFDEFMRELTISGAAIRVADNLRIGQTTGEFNVACQHVPNTVIKVTFKPQVKA